MANKSLMGKLIKTMGKETKASVLTDSDFFEKSIVAKTDVVVNNILLSGKVDGGISPGITQILGESRTWKSSWCLLQVASYLNTYPDAICLFFDSEFGTGRYFKTFGIDTDRVVQIPFVNVEDLVFQLVPALEAIENNDKVIIYVDSISQVASKKEVTNALEHNAAADLTRARAINSLFRIITPTITMKQIPFFVVNSFYEALGNPYQERTVKGGKQIFLSSDTIIFVSRSQEKEGTDLVGWNFNYSIMKSRAVKEKSKFTITVRYDGGIDKYSGMFELALDGGFLEAPKQGWYKLTRASGMESDKLMRRKEFTSEIWDKLISTEAFKQYVYVTYSVDSGVTYVDKTIEDETGEVIDVGMAKGFAE